MKKCKSCIYYKRISGGTNGKACHYAIDQLDMGNVGVTRGCSPENCDKFEPIGGRKKRTTITEEMKVEIMALRANNFTTRKIAERIGISQTSVVNILKKKSLQRLQTLQG